MKFTEDKYPKYTIRLKSGTLAYCRLIDTQEKAVVFFATKELARDWLRTHLPSQKTTAQITELDFETWWHPLLESPRYKWMAFGMNRGPTGIGIISVSEALQACCAFSTNDQELTAADFENEETMDRIHATFVAHTNPNLKRVLAKIREDVESSGTFTPTLFFSNADWAITYSQYPVFDEPHKDKAADLMVNLVREGNVAVGMAAAVLENKQGAIRFENTACKPQAIHVFYEDVGLKMSCMAKVLHDTNSRTLSDWIHRTDVTPNRGRFQDNFEKAQALGPAPGSPDELAEEMRRDLAALARAKGMTEPLTFQELMGHCRQSEIERLISKWNWQHSGIPGRTLSGGPESENQALDDLPLKFWDANIDPNVS